MEIKININNLETFIAALNNAIIAYNDIRAPFFFGIEEENLNSKWYENTGLNYEILTERIEELKYVYDQLLELEKNKYGVETVSTGSWKLLVRTRWYARYAIKLKINAKVISFNSYRPVAMAA